MKTLFGILLLLAFSVGCGGSPSSPSQNANVVYSQTDLIVGTGRVAANGNRVTTNYTGWLYSPTAAENKGQQFDTSIGKTPLSFTLGTGGVIKGWDQGIVGMAVGGKRRLVIPPSLGYGSQGNGPVPGNATLVFDVDLVGVTD